LSFFGANVFAQLESQDEYLRSIPEKHSFNEKKWNESRGRMMKEARGENANSSIKDYNLNPKDVASEPENEGDYYRYEEEGYEGEYAEYENYERADNEEYEGEEDYGEGSNGNSGHNNYHPKDRDLDYGENRSYPEEREHRYNRPRSSSGSSGSVGGLGFLQFILIGLLIALLGFLIYQLFMKTSLDGKGKKVQVILEELAPSEIPKTELELMLERALAEGNYREAVRIYFIFIIKDLSEKEWIRWEKKKTNMSYLIEMRSRSQYDLFNEAVSVFEFVWYGNYKIEKPDFQNLEPKFKSLLNSLNKENK